MDRPQLCRLVSRRGEDPASSAGRWVVRGQGLILRHLGPDNWQVRPCAWLAPDDTASMRWGARASQRLMDNRRAWLAQSGLDQGQFATRSQALEALHWALQHAPPTPASRFASPFSGS